MERHGGYERIVMPSPTNHVARISTRGLLLVIMLAIGAIWLGAVLRLLDGHVGFGDVFTFGFMTLVLAVLWPGCRRAFRRRVPESVTLLGDALLHDSGVDPFRKSGRRRSTDPHLVAQFWKRRTRIRFSAEACRNLAISNAPYENRIYLEDGTGRHDIGEALSAGERAWLFDYLRARLKSAPSSLSSRVAALERELDAEDRTETPTGPTDIYSRHFVDPLDFDDPVARQADWEPLRASSASFRSHDLDRHAGIARFKPTATARGSAASLLIGGCVGVLIGYKDFLAHGSTGLSSGGAVIGALGLVFIVLGIISLRSTFEPIVFDAFRRTYRHGWRNARVIGFDEIKGIQLLSTVLEGNYRTWVVCELNLLLADRSRVPVVCHGDIAAIRQQAAAVAAMVGVPVFDGIKAAGGQAGPRRGPRTGSPLAALIGYAPALLLLGIFFYVLSAPIATPSRDTKRTPDEHTRAHAPRRVLPPIPHSAPVEASPKVAPRTAEPPRRNFQLVAPPGVGRSPAADAPTSEEEWARLERRVTTLAESAVHLEEVGHATGALRVRGYAPDNPAIAGYLRKLKRVGVPRLQIITKVPRDGKQVSEFIISIGVSKSDTAAR